MFNLERDNDTIVAVSTAPGLGGIAVLRVSGPRALEITKKCACFLPNSPESHRVYFGVFLDEAGGEIDETLVTYFANGKSFTGEETLEISCHGSPVLTQRVMRSLCQSGARVADRGEFTYRAFMNGRIDLVQAESVLQLIEARTEEGAKLALRQLKGGLSEELRRIEDDLIWVQANLEANIDFAQEDLVVAEKAVMIERLDRVWKSVVSLLESYKSGKALLEGARIALVGAPNVGKSSLLNALVGEERAIVTEIPGTTRDMIEADCLHNGFRLIFIDTAGVRESTDAIEKIGIQRTKEALESMDFILLVSDDPERRQDPLPEVDKILLINKADLWGGHGIDDGFAVSAKTGIGLVELKDYLAGRLQERLTENAAGAANARHFEILKRMAEGLRRGLGLLREDASPEFVAFELQEAILGVHELLGQRFDDQVMDRVFREFCLGK